MTDVFMDVLEIDNSPPIQLFRSRHEHFVEFTQTELSDRWVIEHNLETIPQVTVIADGILGVLLGDVIHVNINKLVIKFSVPYSGRAFVN